MLEPASTDRIKDIDAFFTKIQSQWWHEQNIYVYAQAGSDMSTRGSTERAQVSGLLTEGEAAETVSIDTYGNETVSRIVIDRDRQTETRIVDYPDSDIDATTVLSNGLLISSTSKSGVTTTYTYDPLERKIGETDPRTGTTITQYDSGNRVEWIEDPAHNRTGFAYDPDTGRKIAQFNAADKATRYRYNARGQVTHTWGDAAYPVHYEYDDSGRLVAMTTYRTDAGFSGETFLDNAQGDTTFWIFDQATGLLEAKEFADSSRITYTYAEVGRLATRTWARTDNGDPIVTTYQYDPATGDLVLIDYSDGTPDIAFAYDRLGRKQMVTDAVGTRTFGYNAYLQLETETITGLYDEVITRTYDTAAVSGRSTGFFLTDGYEIAYGYDPLGRLDLVSFNIGGMNGSAAYTYSVNSDLVEQLDYGNGLLTAYDYETNRNLKTQVTNTWNGNIVSQYAYAYDGVGRRDWVVNSGIAFDEAAVSLYRYNDKDELAEAAQYLGADVADTTQPVQDEYRAFVYDPIGNRTEATIGEAQNSYTANELNQYTELSGANPLTLHYDADGNLIEDSSDLTYQYNAENRLIAVEPKNPAEDDKRVEFLYDYMGRRVQKETYGLDAAGAWQLETQTLFVYDGWNLVSEIIRPTGDTEYKRHFAWGLDLSQSIQSAGGIGGLLAVIDGSKFYHYCYDANGNVAQLVDAQNGTVTAHYEYLPFGAQHAYGDYEDENPFRFSTKYYDEETSLYYYGYRYYSVELGRWINRDPLGETGGKNLYIFVGNNPIIWYDPYGLDWLDNLSNFVAGAGDSLTFGITRQARKGINFLIWGDFHDYGVNTRSKAYIAGEVTEVAVEITVTLGGATLRHAAKHTVRAAAETGARQAYRRAHKLIGGFVHHINPIKGHPGGKIARYPLPYKWAAQGFWNMTWVLNRAVHAAQHARLMKLEALDRLRESTLLIRQVANRIMLYVEENGKCLESIKIDADVAGEVIGTFDEAFIGSSPIFVEVSENMSGTY